MAVLIICIVSLDVPLSQFLLALQKTSTRPITVARVVRWIVCPTSLSKDALLHRDSLWDLLLIFTAVLSSVPEEIDHLIRRLWMIQAYVPSRLLSSYSDGNVRLLHPLSSAIRPTTGSSSCLPNSDSNQSLKLTKELHDWIRDGHSPSGAVSMLNLLSFHPDKQEQYEAYGNPFSKSVATRGSGVAKLVGKIVPGSCSDGCDDWDTVCAYDVRVS